MWINVEIWFLIMKTADELGIQEMYTDEYRFFHQTVGVSRCLSPVYIRL